MLYTLHYREFSTGPGREYVYFKGTNVLTSAGFAKQSKAYLYKYLHILIINCHIWYFLQTHLKPL